jgi:hypothetical protein
MSSSILPDTVVAAMDPTFRPFSFKTADGTIAQQMEQLLVLTWITSAISPGGLSPY